MSSPKLFISYSWTSADHENWVLDLAIQLRSSGIDVILDKWDLREGHDAHAFMERMVTDPAVQKVILICDRVYTEKADGRSGGVGTEAQIISSEIYARQDQSKFVAIVAERDSNGKAYLPAYYRSRIYIDLSDPSRFPESFEQLLRWAYNEPLYRKPELGAKPAFLDSSTPSITLSTTPRYRRAIDALKSGKSYARAATTEYFEVLLAEFEKLRITGSPEFQDEAVLDSIRAFTPYRTEFIDLITTLATYDANDDIQAILHRVFERMIPYLHKPASSSHYKSWDFDNFRYIAHELFLHTLTVLIRCNRFGLASYLLSTEYYIPQRADYGQDSMVPFDALYEPIESFDYRDQRLKLNRISVWADELKQNSIGTGNEFRDLMQTDFILYLRWQLDSSSSWGGWWPVTFAYAERMSAPFELFARSRSSTYFENLKLLLGIKEKSQLETLVQEFNTDKRRLPTQRYYRINLQHIIGLDQIASRP